jgi:hypothetical protein
LVIHDIVEQLKQEFARIDAAITALEGTGSKVGRPNKSGKHRHMSTAACKRISEAMKKRWAAGTDKDAPKRVKVTGKGAARRPQISSAGRKRLSLLMKARWAARKKAGATTL